MKPLVIYHAGCWDGFCAAWVARKALGDCDFVPQHYATPAPDCTGRDVYILDFSFKRPVMRQVLSQANKVVVLDHHKTAEAELAGIVDEFTMRPDLINNPPGSHLPVVWFNMDKSGGRLAWEYFWSTVYGQRFSSLLAESGAQLNLAIAPWLVDYTEDRDLWRHKLDQSRAINAGLRSYPLDFKEWDAIDADPGSRARLATEGSAILRSEKQIIDQHVGHARETEMDGHKVLVVNATVLFSDIAGELAKGRPFGACYFDRHDGKRQWSLRSADDGVDVSEIARAHGGGGHAHAAGFEE